MFKFYETMETEPINVFCREGLIIRLREKDGGYVLMSTDITPKEDFITEIESLTGFEKDEDGFYYFSYDDGFDKHHLISLLGLFLGKSNFVNKPITPETIFKLWGPEYSYQRTYTAMGIYLLQNKIPFEFRTGLYGISDSVFPNKEMALKYYDVYMEFAEEYDLDISSLLYKKNNYKFSYFSELKI